MSDRQLKAALCAKRIADLGPHATNDQRREAVRDPDCDHDYAPGTCGLGSGRRHTWCRRCGGVWGETELLTLDGTDDAPPPPAPKPTQPALFTAPEVLKGQLGLGLDRDDDEGN